MVKIVILQIPVLTSTETMQLIGERAIEEILAKERLMNALILVGNATEALLHSVRKKLKPSETLLIRIRMSLNLLWTYIQTEILGFIHTMVVQRMIFSQGILKHTKSFKKSLRKQSFLQKMNIKEIQNQLLETRLAEIWMIGSLLPTIFPLLPARSEMKMIL
jgi:hypothetical protein